MSVYARERSNAFRNFPQWYRPNLTHSLAWISGVRAYNKTHQTSFIGWLLFACMGFFVVVALFEKKIRFFRVLSCCQLIGRVHVAHQVSGNRCECRSDFFRRFSLSFLYKCLEQNHSIFSRCRLAERIFRARLVIIVANRPFVLQLPLFCLLCVFGN